jgi:CTP synthase
VPLLRADRGQRRRKIALFTNVEERAVIPLLDEDSIYRIPRALHANGLDDFVVERFKLDCPPRT